MTVLKSLFYHAMGYAGASMLYKGIGFVAFLWLAANMNAQSYATMGMLQALQTGITALAAAGIIDALLGQLKHAPSHQEQDQYFRAAMDIFWGLAAVATLLVALLSVPLMELMQASPIDLVAVTCVGILSAFYLTQAYLIRLRERHGASIIVGTLSPLASLIAGVVAYGIFGSVSAFFGGMAFVMLVGLPICARLYVGWGGSAFQKGAIRSIALRMPPFMIVALLSWIVGYGSTFLINIIFTVEEGARFTFAYILSSALQLVATSLNQVWSPRFFKQVHEVPLVEIERQNARFYFLQGIIVGAAGALIIIALPLAIRYLGVDKLQHYQHLEMEMFCLFSVYAVSINWYHSQNYFLAHGRGAAFMGTTIVSTMLGIVLLIAMAFSFGIVGAYIGFILQMLLRSLLTNIKALRIWGVKILWSGPIASISLLFLGVAGSLFIERIS